MAGIIVTKSGVDWTATGGLFDWTLEFLIQRISTKEAVERLQEIVDNNLGSFWITDVPANAQQEILKQWQTGLVAAAKRELPESDYKGDALHHLQELVDLTYL